MARFVAFVAGLTALGLTTEARAQSWLALDWASPNDCEAEPVRAALLQLPAPASPLEARAKVSQSAAGWQLSLNTEYRGARGVRRFEGESCEAIQQAVTLLLSLALESQAEAPPLKTPPKWFVGLTAEGLLGALPKPAVGVVAWLGRRFGKRASLSVRGALFASQTKTGFVAPESRASFSRASLSLRGCYWLWGTELLISPCLGVGAARVGARSFGIDRPSQAQHWFLRAEGALMVRYALVPRFRVVGDLSAGIHEPHDFVVSGIPAPLFADSALEAGVAVGVELLF